MTTMIDLDKSLKWIGNTLFLGKVPLIKIPNHIPKNMVPSAKVDCEFGIRQSITDSQ